MNFGTRQIVRMGKGGRRVVFPITDTLREILFPLQGHHPERVFTYIAVYGNRRLGIVRGGRYPPPTLVPKAHGSAFEPTLE